MDGWFDALRVSAERHGYRLVVLGWGEPWTGLSMKLRLMRDHLRGLPGDDLVCFVDAFDVVVLIDAADLAVRYARLAPAGQVVLAVENPLRQPIVGFVKDAVFGRCGNAPLNIGAYMGPAAAVGRFLDIVRDDDDATDDQKALQRACPRLRGVVVVDDLGDLFFHATCKDHNVTGYLSGGCPFGLGRGPVLINPHTGRPPGVLHAPGGLSLNPVCDLLDLPRGQRPQRLRWIARNFWRELLASVLLLAAVLWLTRRAVASVGAHQSGS